MSNATHIADHLRKINLSIDTLRTLDSDHGRSDVLEQVLGCFSEIPAELARLDSNRSSIGTCKLIDKVTTELAGVLATFAALTDSVEQDAATEDDMCEREASRRHAMGLVR